MTAPPVYDRIGVGYTTHRRADPRLVNAIVEQLALAPGATIADVGAGSGNYTIALAERGFHVKAIEPSDVMRRQAQDHPGVEWMRGVAEAVPLENGSVDGVVCTLAFHHFASARQAVREMARVSTGPVLLFTYDPRASEPLWLEDYIAEIIADAWRLFPPVAEVAALFEEAGLRASTAVFALPHDLQDLFLAAAWRRPHLHLDPQVRFGMSGFSLADEAWVEARMERLREDLESGAWEERHGAVLRRESFDAGYRFVCARPRRLTEKFSVRT